MPRGRSKIRMDGGFIPSRHIYESLTNGRRLEIALFARSHGVQAAVEKFFSGATSDVQETKRKLTYEWMEQIPALEDVCKTTRGRISMRTRRIGSATTLPVDAERMLVLWINALRDEGVPASSLMLHIKALDIACEFAVSVKHLLASWLWQQLFLRRHSFTFRRRTRCSQIQPQITDEVMHATNTKINKLMARYGVDIVYNADQTAVFFEYIPESTLAPKGKKTVWVRSAGKEKERVTVMLLGDSHGAKFTPFVVVKMQPSRVPNVLAENQERRNGFGIKTWKEIQAAQYANDLQIHANGRGWWTGDLRCQFLQYHFGGRTDKSDPLLLLWDDFAGHWTEAVRRCAESLNVVLVPVPPGFTSVYQPTDISWNYPLKTRLRKHWLSLVSKQILSKDNAKPFKLRAPTRVDIMGWIGEAWSGLSASTAASGFHSVVNQIGEETEDYTALVAALDRLDLLGKRLGEVAESDDVVAAELGVA